MSDRASWIVTTHDWSNDLDREHLTQIRSDASRYGAGGCRHMILEVLAYASDEAEFLGRVVSVVVTTQPDGTVSVSDDGRGTDTRVDATGAVVRKPVMATRDVRFFDSLDSPRLPDGLPRRGMSTVAALSSVLVHENRRPDGAWAQIYRHGIPDGELRAIPAGGASGTCVTFRAGAGVHGPQSLTATDLTAFRCLRIEVAASAGSQLGQRTT